MVELFEVAFTCLDHNTRVLKEVEKSLFTLLERLTAKTGEKP